ncbi:DNA-binding protein HU-beta [Hypnocyclicus thermotrophus]|uniref:DNA-binding protein HU-beta n=1 Tax=Hypnocyclicus thermotrophus TaxID=1627895 RepID=A0AA46DYC2_9FUSO|nr:HU family DNA-binding protein [Hypnocyclicus thermotrophus]TDT69160.1 DNA-binding protein HU-beta [Hypnocyclicus thermotrophus]
MTKKELIEIYAENAELGKKEATKQVEGFLEAVQTALIDKGAVQFVGWGTFEVKQTKERIGRNPQTGEAMTIPARKVVKFKVGKKLAEKVNE